MNESKDPLAAKLENLFAEVRKPDGSRYTQAEVVQGTQGKLTRVYLWKLRTGRATNPGYQIIKALADFFGVDTNYFSEGGGEAGFQEDPFSGGKYFKEIQERAAKMDDKAQKAILALMDYILSIQK
jgi:transcriptional regulator with XRE-family HTH domain